MSLQLLATKSMLKSDVLTKDLLDCLETTRDHVVAGLLFTYLSSQLSLEQLKSLYKPYFIFSSSGPLEHISERHFNELSVEDFEKVFSYLLKITTEDDLLSTLKFLDQNQQFEVCLELRARGAKITSTQFFKILELEDPPGLHLLIKQSNLSRDELVKILYHAVSQGLSLELIKVIDQEILRLNQGPLFVDDLLKNVYRGMILDYYHVVYYLENGFFEAWTGAMETRNRIELFYGQAIGNTMNNHVQFLKHLFENW